MSEHTTDLLLRFNKSWAEKVKNDDPHFFQKLSEDQHPNYLWIGCSDSRVPETLIMEQHPGDLFVHRNIANLVLHSDINCQSVLQYAVQVLKVKHIIVCGHYDCGGIKAALHSDQLGLIDNWLGNIREIHQKNLHELDLFESEREKINRLAELNVMEQVHHVSENPFVKQEWSTGRELWIHGWIYDLKTGRLKDMHINNGQDETKSNTS